MQVVCNNLDEFLGDLNESLRGAVEPSNLILQGCIRTSVSENTVSEAVTQIILKLTAVVILPEGGEYLLSVGLDCGKDYNDASQEKPGTAKYCECMKYIEDFCVGRGLKVRSGIIQI